MDVKAEKRELVMHKIREAWREENWQKFTAGGRRGADEVRQ